MELRQYLGIVSRSWRLVVGLPALVAVLTVVVAFVLPEGYTITAAMLVTQRPIGTNEAQITLPDENNFNSWAASEYVVDDILQLVETQRFASDIAAWLQQTQNVTLDARRISEGLTAERKHRMVYLTVQAQRSDYARLIAQGAVEMLRQNGLQYWNRAESTSLNVSELDLPEQARRTQGLARLALDVVLRSILALVLAIGLAFLRHHLDRSLRHVGEVEALGLEVVGIIPRDGSPGPQP